MATTAVVRAQHQQNGGQGQQYQPLRRMEGLSLRSALRSDPRVPALAAAALLVPLAAALLGLAGLFLLVTLAGVALAAPFVLLFSPVLVPAALGAALAVAGLAAAGALAVSGLSALVWVVGYVQRGLAQGDSGRVGGMVVQPLNSGKRYGGQGAPAFVGHRVGGDVGDALGAKARDVAST
ncbi:oleosin 14.9 kDa-like [Hordeum vulgare]|nr:oleosin H1-like [Hordeum vulgare subsp. vulgare]KAE8780164.1 oleosin 14.9 kDa-like [Hordeum vulgare]BAK06054.1 predicted protein [Hordeum vulgare subsp. vulgare]